MCARRGGLCLYFKLYVIAVLVYSLTQTVCGLTDLCDTCVIVLRVYECISSKFFYLTEPGIAHLTTAGDGALGAALVDFKRKSLHRAHWDAADALERAHAHVQHACLLSFNRSRRRD